MHKRMVTWLVTVEWVGNSGHTLRRKIAENALTSLSAHRKVMAHYNKASMIKKLGKPYFISVIRSTNYGG